MHGNARRTVLATTLALLATACAAPTGGDGVEPAAPAATDAPAPAATAPVDGAPSATDAPAGDSPAAPAAAPAAPAAPAQEPPRLRAGDRWFVAWKSGSSRVAAERHRLVDGGDGAFREEVTWARTFSSLSDGKPLGAPQVFRLRVTDRGLEVSPLAPAGSPADANDAGAAVEIAAPYAPGTTWEVHRDGTRAIRGHIVGRETVATPAGPVAKALKVTHTALGGSERVMTTWYDADLRPVRAEVREPDGTLVEARAALSGPSPDAKACEAALKWAEKQRTAK